MLAEALARYVEAHGGKVATNAPVDKFIVHGNEAKGLKLQDGSEILAGKATVTSLDPRQSFLHMVDDGILHNDFVSLVKGFSFGDIGVFRAHYAINEAPEVFKRHGNGKNVFSKDLFFNGCVAATVCRHRPGIAAGQPVCLGGMLDATGSEPRPGRETHPDSRYFCAKQTHRLQALGRD